MRIPIAPPRTVFAVHHPHCGHVAAFTQDRTQATTILGLLHTGGYRAFRVRRVTATELEGDLTRFLSSENQCVTCTVDPSRIYGAT